MPFTVAIVGKPNVGKSSLFNRLIGERKAITDDKPGVTRDRIYGIASWLTKKFAIIDTGGIEIGDAPFLEQIHQQALLAIEESDLVLFVLDGRIGIDEAELHFIFDRFYRADASRNSKSGGSGLGLAIAKKVIEDHFGTIWASSEKDKGTTISFTLKKAV